MTRSRPHVRFKPDTAQIIRDVVGSLLAVVFVRRVGRNRRDTQQAEKTLDAFVEVLIDMVEDGLKIAHG
jgi:hypothetical protein